MNKNSLLRERWFKFSKILTVGILSFITLNLIITLLRTSITKPINLEFNNSWALWVFYGLIVLLLLITVTSYIIMTVPKIKYKLNPFVTKSEFIMLFITLSVISNYWIVGDWRNFWNGYLLSNIFDIVMIFATITLLYLIVINIIKVFTKKVTKVNNHSHSSLSSDKPITSLEEDRLKRADFAKKLADSIAQQGNDSITIGLLGQWGSGKSSIYNMIKKYSDIHKQNSNSSADSNIIYIDFKPWYFGKDDHDIIKIFLFHFLNELKKTNDYSPELGKAIKQYANVLSSLSVGNFGATFSFKELINRFIPNEETMDLADLKKEIEDLLEKFPQKIVVYIDDIDRLEGSEVRMIFKLVRLVADFPKVTYIIALDEEVVAKSLLNVYMNEGQATVEEGKKYLEKFIQIPIYLPKAEDVDLRIFYSEQLNKLLAENGVDGKRIHDVVDNLIDLRFSPRNFYRYKNLAQFYLPFLKEEINVIDLLYLIIIQVKSSDLYNYIYENKSLFLNDASEASKLKKEELNKVDQINNLRHIVVSLFPYSKPLLGFKYHSAKDKTQVYWKQEKRICTEDFFDQYFKYAIPTNKLSQSELTFFLDFFNDSEIKYIKEQYLALERKYNTIELNTKLELRLNEINTYLDKLLIVLLELINQEYRVYKASERFSGLMKFSNLLIEKMYMNDYEFNAKIWDDININILIKIDGYLASDKGIRVSSLKKVIRNCYITISKFNFYADFEHDEATFLWKNWNKYFDYNEIKQFTSKWIKTNEDFENFLKFTFKDEDINMRNKGEIPFENLMLSLRSLSDNLVEKYFQSNFEEFIASKSNQGSRIETFIKVREGFESFVFESINWLYMNNLQTNTFNAPPSNLIESAEVIIKFSNNKEKKKMQELLQDFESQKKDLIQRENDRKELIQRENDRNENLL